MKKIIIGLLVLSMMIMLVGCDTAETSSDNIDTSSITEDAVVQQQVLVDNDIIKVTFIEAFEEPSIQNTCYLRLKGENKTDQTVTIYPKDSYVNDTAVILLSGIPMDILSGKNSQTPFFFSYQNLDIDKIDDIETIELKIWVVDESFNTIFETDSLTINFNANT